MIIKSNANAQYYYNMSRNSLFTDRKQYTFYFISKMIYLFEGDFNTTFMNNRLGSKLK
jgi:translation elongation factor P/translation initiation factor 5A